MLTNAVFVFWPKLQSNIELWGPHLCLFRKEKETMKDRATETEGQRQRDRDRARENQRETEREREMERERREREISRSILED